MRFIAETFSCHNPRCGTWARVEVLAEDDGLVFGEDLEAAILNKGWLILLQANEPDRKYCSRDCLEADVCAY